MPARTAGLLCCIGGREGRADCRQVIFAPRPRSSQRSCCRFRENGNNAPAAESPTHIRRSIPHSGRLLPRPALLIVTLYNRSSPLRLARQLIILAAVAPRPGGS